ncbi:MAG: protein-glutamate O-methyltransferase CheR [Candidatus Eisenbacteria bacterium]|nr:protein-glutamate O-methyltransferase CheR [Candidatus Eisenbacteria bacterium]
MSLSATDFDYIRTLVMKRSAIVLEAGKEYLVESRLIPLAKREGFSGLEEMCAGMRAKASPALVEKVVEAMTTNETSFFRDLMPFEAMKKQIVPELIAARGGSKCLSIWSAASSSGQEIYSLAMLLRENFPALRDWRISLLATDLSQEMVARTKQGLFSQLEVNRGLPAPLLIKYFTKEGTHWQIKQELRDLVEVRQMNLAESWKLMPQLDVVFLRNVLIYFSVETKREILGRVREILRPDGTLFLGAAETTLNIDENWTRVQIDKTSCYRPGAAELRKAA